jgi:hypothetical protein
LNAIGFLGAALVVLGILGYVGVLVSLLGGLIVAISTYSMYKFHQDISILAFSISYQTAMMMEDEEEHEEE